LEEPNRPDNPEEPDSALDPTADLDRLIAQREAELARLVALAPAYKLLEDNVAQAHENYQHMQDKYTEAAIKAQSAKAANFIQVVGNARPPLRPVSNLKWLALALTGSLGFAVLLAFSLDYIPPFERPAPEQAIVVALDSLLQGLRRSLRAAKVFLVTRSPRLEAPGSMPSEETPELDSPKESK
jgi:hypothetical protein